MSHTATIPTSGTKHNGQLLSTRAVNGLLNAGYGEVSIAYRSHPPHRVIVDDKADLRAWFAADGEDALRRARNVGHKTMREIAVYLGVVDTVLECRSIQRNGSKCRSGAKDGKVFCAKHLRELRRLRGEGAA